MNYETKMAKLLKAVVALGIISVLALAFRLWPLFIIAFALFVGANVWRRRLKKNAPKQQSQPCVIPTPTCDADNKPTVYEQISAAVRERFPDAKWVWAQPDTLRKLADGEDVFIVLNQAGGYRKAKVLTSAGQVTDIALLTGPVSEKHPEPETEIGEARSESQPIVNYGLVAFEWKDAHILELNERINDAIGRGESELFLAASELPVKESWGSICEELRREGLKEVVCADNGITIKIMQ